MKAALAPPQETTRKPRYVEVADDLRGQILSGGLAVDRFPTESVLCARYGVSRFTVREALRTLQNEGLIQRRRGSGTVIQAAAARGGALHQPLSNVGEILQYARDSRFAFARDGTVPLPRTIAEQAGIAEGGRWPRFRGLRSHAGAAGPIAVTDAYIHPTLADAADRIDTTADTIFRQLERLGRLRIAHITQDIQAVPATADIAAALNVPRRSACLRILRCYVDDGGRAIEISASHHPGTRFAYNMHIEVEG